MKKVVSVLLIFGLLLPVGVFGSGNEKCEYKKLGEYDDIYSLSIPDIGSNFAFNAYSGSTKIVVNKYYDYKYKDQSTSITFSGDGSSLSFVIFERIDDKKKYTLIKDGVRIATYDYIGNLIYSQIGNDIYFLVHDNGSSMIIKNGKEIIHDFGSKIPKTDEYGFIYEFVYSPESNNYMYKLKPNGGDVIIKDGAEIITNSNIYGLTYSSNGDSFAYKGFDFIVKDGIKSELYDDILYFTYSQDGKDLYYVVKKDRIFKVFKNFEEINVKGLDEIAKHKSFLIDNVSYSIINNSLIFSVLNNSTYSIYNNGSISQKFDSLIDLKHQRYGNLLYFIINENGRYMLMSGNCKLKKELIKQLIISKKELNKTVKGKKYIILFNSFVNKGSIEQLKIMNSKIDKIDKSSNLYSKYKYVFEYLEAKILLELKKREEN